VTVKLKLPGTVGIPERSPAAERVIPPGRLPSVTAYVNGPVPPADEMDWEYAVPVVPFGRVGGVTVIVPQTILIEYASDPVHPCASVAVTVNEYVPIAVGVPARDPPTLRDKPGGSVPAETANE